MASYPESKSARRGRALLAVRNPLQSQTFDDVDVIEEISGSRKFARDFVSRFGGLSGLLDMNLPHDLRVLPSATYPIISKMTNFYEGAARLAIAWNSDSESSKTAS
jgi:hypothetical protein